MCGICGFSWEDEAVITAMTQVMVHRGPDQWGIHVGQGISLGHRRLSILDLSPRGRQPMATPDGKTWIVYNGEIYNFREIRNVLEAKGYTFRTQTDTEVILYAYREYGYECLSHLNGMFSFAIWDGHTRNFFLARDRLGVKPLYYWLTQSNGRYDIVFASEIKALLQNPAVSRRIDPQALYEFLGYEFVPAPRTILEGVQKLPAGHAAVFHASSGLRTWQYWDIDLTPRESSRQDLEAQLYEHLEQAVQRRLISDVPLGAFLSGGIDSSSVVACMSRLADEPVRTFALGYREAHFSEFGYAKTVAKHFGTDHTELVIDPVSESVIERVIWHLDEPLSEFSVVPYYLISKKAREHITVCLSGEGGDELFVGYDRFKASQFARKFLHLPQPMIQALLRLSALIPDLAKKKGFWNSLRRFLEGAALPPTGLHMRWQYFLTGRTPCALLEPDFIHAIDADPFAPITRILDGKPWTSPLDRELYVELRFMMPENPLMKVDKMSMAHGLEVRAPFLDYRLVEFVNAIPSQLKLEGWTTKAILKSAMNDRLPSGIAHRSKHGYSFPIKHWLRNELRKYMADLLSDEAMLQEYIRPAAVRRLMEEHWQGTHNHSHILWALMNFVLWRRMFLHASIPASGGREAVRP